MGLAGHDSNVMRNRLDGCIVVQSVPVQQGLEFVVAEHKSPCCTRAAKTAINLRSQIKCEFLSRSGDMVIANRRHQTP